jgi:hypothetical protein
MKSIKNHRELNGSLSKSKSANKSAKRKRTGAHNANEDHTLTGLWEGFTESGQDIEALSQADTPLRKRRGRLKGSQNKRPPTPEEDLPPEERYFFQNRSGPPNASSSTLTSLKLLTYEKYFDQIKKYRDHHELDRQYSIKLHSRSFSQWRFEPTERFNICLYGWGSKRQLLTQYAEWIHQRSTTPPKTVRRQPSRQYTHCSQHTHDSSFWRESPRKASYSTARNSRLDPLTPNRPTTYSANSPYDQLHRRLFPPPFRHAISFCHACCPPSHQPYFCGGHTVLPLDVEFLITR